jgi:integrase
VSKDYNYEVGYESLQKDFERYQKQTPRGVGLVKKAQGIYLQFKTPNTTRKQYACSCSFTLDGMVDALSKANKVADKLKTLSSEVEFWNWYDKEIKQGSQLVDDRLTFEEAIAKVEDDFWSRPSRTKRDRDKSNPSDLSSWYRTYGCFYQQLPQEKIINLEDVAKIIARQKKGSRNYKYAVSAMKKLATTNKRRDIYDELDSINVIQTKNAKLQTVTLEDFLNWRDKALGITADLSKSVDLNSRKAWLWVFSMQVVYGLRVSEVFAIANLDESLMSDDGIPIPALKSLDNTDNLIFIEDRTNLGTTVKTGYRMARPLIPPKCPNLMELLEIKKPLLPTNKPCAGNSETIRKFYSVKARKLLINWNAPFTQTHALRHLANINGIQAGIPQEVRAQSLGHTVQMNESVYKKRQSTQTTIDLLLNSNQNAIDFVTALGEAKKLVRENESNKEIIAQLLSIIYQKNTNEIHRLL